LWLKRLTTITINIHSLHDALPIYQPAQEQHEEGQRAPDPGGLALLVALGRLAALVALGVADRLCQVGARSPPRPTDGQPAEAARSEEHTSELQSRENLVCRLLLEK